MGLQVGEHRRSRLLHGKEGGGGEASKQSSRGSVIQKNEFDRVPCRLMYSTMGR